MKLYVETKTIKHKGVEYILVRGFRKQLRTAPARGLDVFTTYVEEDLSHSEQRAWACEQVAELKGNNNVLLFANFPY